MTNPWIGARSPHSSIVHGRHGDCLDRSSDSREELLVNHDDFTNGSARSLSRSMDSCFQTTERRAGIKRPPRATLRKTKGGSHLVLPTN
jgi:hypothetical protein